MISETLDELDERHVAPEGVRYSVVVPVYGNEDTLATLLGELGTLATDVDGPLEAVFVVDGSPDGSLVVLRRLLSERLPFSAQLIALSRNFGSFSAIRVGLAAASGEYVAVMAADLQEPVSLVRDFFRALATGEHDIAVGVRTARADPFTTVLAARIFWSVFRRLGQPELPRRGVDVFACTRQVAGELIRLRESHSSLVGLLYWVGFRRIEIPYERRSRAAGKTGWRFRRKLRYFMDSIFSFTDIPILAIIGIGLVGATVSLAVGVAVLVAWLAGSVDVAGYTPIMLAIVFTASSVLVSLGVIGSYVWRTYENTKGRPIAIAMTHERFAADAPSE
ncbi:MAG: glycosyltransferase family 2 protein [Gaiellaceae bacterium]